MMAKTTIMAIVFLVALQMRPRAVTGSGAQSSKGQCWPVQRPDSAFADRTISGSWAGAERICCPVEGRKFFLYKLEAEKLCHNGEKLLELAKNTSYDGRQYLGMALFLRQQLEDHPWRTLDPSTADLFVLPAILDIADMVPHGCSVDMQALLHALQEELLSSPHYRRSLGTDHLLPVFSWRVTLGLHSSPSYLARFHSALGSASSRRQFTKTLGGFRKLVRYMVLAERMDVRGQVWHGRRDRILRTNRTLVVPYLPPGIVDTCLMNGAEKIECKAGPAAEETFGAYKTSRNNTVFFIGNADRAEAPRKLLPVAEEYISKKQLRQLVVYKMEGLKLPKILMDTSTNHNDHEVPACDLAKGPTSACQLRKSMAPGAMAQLLRQSLFSVHVRGDDATSSRVYEAIASGTPQLFLASRWYEDGAPFKCVVPWEKMYKPINEIAFEIDPVETMEKTLSKLLDEPEGDSVHGRLGKLWQAQKDAAADVLWHLPGSRVAHNVIEEALRLVLGVDRSHTGEL